MDNGISPITLIVVGSFAIDRIVSGLLFLLSMPKAWQQIFPDPDLIQDPAQRALAAKKRKLAYFFLAAILSVPVVALGDLGLLSRMGLAKPELHGVQWWLDCLLTSMIFMGGADVFTMILKKHSDSVLDKPNERAIQVVGSLTVDDGDKGSSGKSCPSCGVTLEGGSSYCAHCGSRVAASAGAA